MKPEKRSFKIAGHRTSISLEAPFWVALREITAAEQLPLAQLIARVDSQRGRTNLSSAVRVYILEYYRSQLAPKGSELMGATIRTDADLDSR